LYAMKGSEKAEPLYKTLIKKSREVFGDEHPKTLILLGNFGAYYRSRGRAVEAIPIFREAFDAQTKVLGPAHRQTLIAASNLASALAWGKQTDEALTVVNEALKRSITEHGDESDTTLFLTVSLGTVLRQDGRLDEAENAMRRSIDLHLRIQGPDSEGTFHAQHVLINLYIAREKNAEAIELAEPLIFQIATLFSDEHPRLVMSRYNLARAYMGSGHYEEAESMLMLAYKGSDPVWRTAIEKLLVRLYKHLNRPDEAKKWQSTLDKSNQR